MGHITPITYLFSNKEDVTAGTNAFDNIFIKNGKK